MKDFEIRCDESRLETTNLIYGKFTLGPFLPGQATTFGNALRRSLLAELSGLAITAFEIIGAMQEFSTLPGLRESILDLSLNLKQTVLTGVLPHSTPPIGFLNVRGPAIIKAIDLKLPAGVYCASPNQYIATLGSNGMLHIKFAISVGKGYSIQPYSIYRSLSKVKLQPTSNFDNMTYPEEGAGRINYGKQVPPPLRSYESFKNVTLSSAALNPISSQTTLGKGYNKKTSGFVKAPSKMNFANSKESFVQSKEGPLPHTSYPYRGIESISVGGKEGVLDKSDKSKSRRTIPSGYAQRERACLAETMQGGGVCNSLPSKEGLSKQIDQEQALLYKASPSTFFTNDYSKQKNLNSSYINIQTQLFQRITPHQVLPIDAVFTPVSQVNFLTEVNDRLETARENIVLEIWTNGSIHPKRALEEATLSLVQNFDILLKKIQQASSFYKGLRYWTYLQPFKSSLGKKTNGFSPEGINSLYLLEEVEKKALLAQHDRACLTGFNGSSKKGFTQLKDQEQRSIVGETLTEELAHRGKGYSSSKKHLKEDFSYSSNKDEELQKKLFKKDLPESIYNLDIGNLNLSLQTFIFLKKAKIHTLLQLLTHFSLKQNTIPISSSLPAQRCGVVSPHTTYKSTICYPSGYRRYSNSACSETHSNGFSDQTRKYVTPFRESSICTNLHLDSNLLNEKIIDELNDVIKQFGAQD